MTKTLERLVSSEGHLRLLDDVELSNETFNIKFNGHANKQSSRSRNRTVARSSGETARSWPVQPVQPSDLP